MLKQEFRVLNPKKTNYVPYDTLIKKYQNSEKINFQEQELKSIIAFVFALKLHNESFQKIPPEINKMFLNVTNIYLQTSIDFGLTLLDNVTGSNNKTLKMLLSKTYTNENILLRPEFTYFTDEILFSQMNIRRWEYGRYFLENFASKMEVTKKNTLGIANNGDFWGVMLDKMTKIKTEIDNYEAVLLAYLLKNKLEKQELYMDDYSLLGNIAIQKMSFINKREQVLKQAINEIISLDLKLNKGKGRKL